jgi:hypothetical protein
MGKWKDLLEFKLERGMAKQEEEGKRMKEQMEEMRRILDGVDNGEEGPKEELLAKTFQGVNIFGEDGLIPPKLSHLRI